MTPLLLMACAWTLAGLLLLAWLDPKSRRARRAPKLAVPRHARRWLVAACLLPGLSLIWLGAWPAVLMWLGAATLSGWLLAIACLFA